MKLLATVLILLTAGYVQAQTTASQSVVDAARQERARQARSGSSRVFTDANAHSPETTLAAPSKPDAAAPSAPAKTKESVSAPDSPAGNSAVNQQDAQIQKLRTRIRELEDQETALKLQINDVTNQVYAPVTDAGTHNDALSKLGDIQTKLADLQKDLAQNRADLQQMEAEAQAAPKK